MNRARRVSKYVNDELFNAYGNGLFVPHNWSNPDVEAVMTSINNTQDPSFLMDQISHVLDRPKDYNNQEVFIRDMKFSYPHSTNRHDVPAPHPSMTDEEILQYIWPNASLNRQSSGSIASSYTGQLWVDIHEPDTTFNISEGRYIGTTTSDSRWISILEWPVMVGSNLCNIASLRHYLSDPEYEVRTRYLLDEVIKYDSNVPDGHYVITGKTKRICILDRIMMNTIYLDKVSVGITSPYSSIKPDGTVADDTKVVPVGHRVAEIRSVREGIAYHKMFMTYTEGRAPTELDSNVYKLYNSIAVINSSAFSVPFNIINLIRIYASVVMDMDPELAIENFKNEVFELSNHDQEVARFLAVTEDDAITSSVEHLTGLMRLLIIKKGNVSVDDTQDILGNRLEHVILPHCNYTSDKEDVFYAKIRIMAMMFINLVASIIPRTSIGEVLPTDKKDFSFKRWEAPGHQMKSYLRNYIRAIRKLNKVAVTKNNLISMMRQNKWATEYIPYSRDSRGSGDYLDGVVDDVSNYNVVSMLDSIRTIKINTKASGNTSAARRIHTSQWGAQCIANTPENNNIGLINNLAEAVLISEDLDHEDTTAFNSFLEDVLDGPMLLGDHMLIIDGVPRGTVSEDVYYELHQARMDGIISRSIGLAIHKMWDSVPVIVVRTTHGRPLIPVFRIDEDSLKFLLEEDSDIFQKNTQDMLDEGIIEFIDSYEMSWSCVVAEWLYTRDRDGSYVAIDADKYTHSMIKPGHILSQASNTLPFIEHNPAARGTYATVHVKQSIGRPYKHEKIRFDNDTNYLMNPEPSILLTDTAKRLGMADLGIGRNIRIACMSYDSNRDDAVLFSDKLVSSGALDGYHYNIFRSERGVTINNRYNWIIQELPSGDHIELRGLIDPEYSDSIILPYGSPHILEIDTLPEETEKGLYELEDGRLYRIWGTYRPITVTYDDGSTRDIIPGSEAYDIPGKVRVSSTRGSIVYKMALSFVTKEWRDLITTGREDGYDLGWHDTPFISSEPTMGEWYGPVSASIPRTIDGSNEGAVIGQLRVLYPRRRITRGDTAMKLVERELNTILGVQKEKFDITYGFIDGIERGSTIRIKGAMPIGPKAGNKYAALYAQKNINVGIIPRDKMPIAKWHNSVLNQDEEMEFDIVFNPLSFPSRMTMGMILEIFIAGTVDYIYRLKNEDGIPLRQLYMSRSPDFNAYMSEVYDISDASSLIDDLTDVTAFMYDNDEKIHTVRDIRTKLGIPSNSEYDTFIDGEKLTNKIFAGTVYYVALRHLVDNKRRARGYVGRKNAVTFQPVKGRRRDGGARTGQQEKDAYAAHGASRLLHERMATTSDAITLFKCDKCGGLATKIRPREYKCLECEAILPPSEVTRHHTVWSYQLLTYYLRAIGANINEIFK